MLHLAEICNLYT